MSEAPVCPNCGAKHSFSKSTLKCNKCGLPAEIRDMGPEVIARWKRKHLRETMSKKQAKRATKKGSAAKTRNKHGRRGAPHLLNTTAPDPGKFPNPVSNPVDPPKVDGTLISIDEDEK